MLVIGWIRHGITDWNEQGKIQGGSDIPLNHNGLKQAKHIADKLNDSRWDRLFTSDLQRAIQTADCIAEKIGVQPIIEPLIRERSFGEVEGLTRQERSERYGEQDWKANVKGLESDAALLARGLAFIDQIITAAQGRDLRILAVSHGGFMKQLLQHLLQQDEIPFIHNASLFLIQYDGNRWLQQKG